MTRQVLIVEDHPLVAEATASLVAFASAGLHPVVSSSAAATIDLLDQGIDAWFRIFLDLDVPGAYGLSLAKEIRERGGAGRTCVVSAFDKGEYIDTIREWGFLGYIAKATSVAEFKAAILGILEGTSPFFPKPTAKRPQALRLTRRQGQLIELIQRGFSSREIAAELHITEGTVNNQVAAVMQVIDADSRAHAVARAIELGLLNSTPQGLPASSALRDQRDRR